MFVFASSRMAQRPHDPLDCPVQLPGHRDASVAIHLIRSQRKRLTFARSMSWVARPSRTAFVMKIPK